MISVRINREDYPLPPTSSLKDMLNSLQVAEEGIAIAVNQQVIKRSEWSEWELKPNDDILIIKATQGG